MNKNEVEELDELRQSLGEGLFGRMSFAERWEPIVREGIWAMRGCQDSPPRARVLPDYCYNILQMFRRTYLRIFPSFGEILNERDKELLAQCKSFAEARARVRLDWRRMGRVIGVWIRVIRFLDLEFEPMLEGLQKDLNPEEQERLLRWLCPDRWFRGMEKELLDQLPGQVAEQAAAEQPGALSKASGQVSAYWSQVTYQWGPEAVAEFNAGMAEGVSGFMDAVGKFKGESNRANVYAFLLVAWPEIKEMQESTPPKSRTDFYEWVKPFARIGMVSIGDLDQLHDVCDDIRLSFKGRGAPHKV